MKSSTNILFDVISKKKSLWMLAYLIFGSALPITLFFFEYSDARPLSVSFEDYNKFLFNVITTYSPLFLYALIAGFLLPSYLIPAYEFFKITITNKRVVRIRKTLLVFSVAMAIVVAIADLFGGAAAIWELKPPSHAPYIKHFIEANSNTPMIAKQEYETGIQQTINQGLVNWSSVRFSYIFSILIEAFFLNVFFHLSFLFFAFRKILKNANPIIFQKLLNGLIISSFLIFVWLLLRVMNTEEKTYLYATATLQDANIAIGVLNLFCLYAITITRFGNDQVRKLANDIGGVSTALGITGISFIAIQNPQVLISHFGKNAALINYIVFPIVFLLLYTSYFVINLGKQIEDETPIEQAVDDITE